MADEYQNGNRPMFSRNEAVRYAVMLVAVVTFAITLKNNQDNANRRIDALTVEIAALRADRARDRMEVQADIEDWKRATTGMFFKRQGSR